MATYQYVKELALNLAARDSATYHVNVRMVKNSQGMPEIDQNGYILSEFYDGSTVMTANCNGTYSESFY